MRNQSWCHAAMVVSLLALFIGVPSFLPAEEINREFHETFEVEPGMLLKLKHGDGDVTITPWEQDTLDVQVRYRAKSNNVVGWSSKVDLDVRFSREGDTIYVVGTEPSLVSIGFSSFREYEYIYKVQAPSYLMLDLIGEDGDVSIEEWRAELELRTEDGDVKLTSIHSPRTEITLEDGDLEISGLQGELLVETEDGDLEIYDCQSDHGKIRTEDGDVELHRCIGNFEIQADDGDIRMSKLTPGEVEIRVADGSIDLDLLPSEELELILRVGDGDIDVALDEKISAAFDLETRDGRIRVHAASVADLHKENRRVTGRVGDGTGSIHMSSVDGNITLRQ